ncbi:MAG: BON domain-containing protein [Candidatus Binatia bacterium]
MAHEHEERGHRFEQHRQRGEHGESERYRRDRGHDDRDYFGQRELEDDPTRPADRRHWRGHDYYDPDNEFERVRDYGAYDREREPRIGVEHRNPFLRRSEDEERYRRRGEMRPYQSHGREGYRDDDRGSGPYAGRGPKGYRRSDDRILEEVCERLTDHPSIDATEIDVTVADGDVTLTGRVESRTVKHLTENMVETVSGVKEVHNQLRITAQPNPANDWQQPTERRAADPDPEASKMRKR